MLSQVRVDIYTIFNLITDSQNLNETRFKNKFDPYQYLQMSSIKVTFSFLRRYISYFRNRLIPRIILQLHFESENRIVFKVKVKVHNLCNIYLILLTKHFLIGKGDFRKKNVLTDQNNVLLD